MPLICYQAKNFGANGLAIIERANEILAAYAADGYDLTLRQLYYQFVARDIFANQQKNYDMLGRIISEARMAGLVDWDRIVDRTRQCRINSHWENPGDIIAACAKQFRVDRWENQKHRPYVMIEKDALVGIFEGVCREMDVPLLSCRGYTSQSELWQTGRRMKEYVEAGQAPLVLHFGDHDPSGIDMTRDLQERLSIFAEEEIDVIRLALNMEQVEKYKPPPNPAKTTDARFADYESKFGRESWELDALEPRVLTALVRAGMKKFTDKGAWAETGQQEEGFKEKLSYLSEHWEAV